MLVYRLDKLIYANRAFLDWTGYDQLHALEEAGGLDALFVEPNNAELGENNGAQSLTIATNQGDQVPVEARLFTSPVKKRGRCSTGCRWRSAIMFLKNRNMS